MTYRRALCLLILATLLWSMAGVVTRHLDAARSFEVTFWRSLFNALTLMMVLSVMRGPGFLLAMRQAQWPVWVSGLCWAVMYTAFMVAMTLTTVATVLVTMAVGPLVTALFARVVLGHRLPGRTWLAIALAALGMGWMYGREALDGASLTGTLVASVVPLAAAANWIVLQFVASRRQHDSAAAPDMMPAVLIGALLSSLATAPAAFPLQASAHDVALLALLGVLQLAVPCLIAVRISRELPAAEMSLYGMLEVIFGVTWAWLWGGETPSWATLTGGSLVIFALVVNELLGRHAKAMRRHSRVVV